MIGKFMAAKTNTTIVASLYFVFYFCVLYFPLVFYSSSE